MPVIVYKTLTIEFFYAQGRRILCDQCGRPFCYVVGGVESAQTYGLPVVSGDRSMRETAVKQALEGLRRTAKRENVGEAICPHCQCYQRWMVSSSLFCLVGFSSVLGAFVLGIVGALVNFFQGFRGYGWVIGGSAGIGALLGVIFGRMMAITVGPHPGKQDARAMSDERFQEFVAQCDDAEADPFLSWWLTLGNEPGEKQAVVSLGLEDRTGRPIYPEAMSTDCALGNAG